jgi:hypothetical protein
MDHQLPPTLPPICHPERSEGSMHLTLLRDTPSAQTWHLVIPSRSQAKPRACRGTCFFSRTPPACGNGRPRPPTCHPERSEGPMHLTLLRDTPSAQTWHLVIPSRSQARCAGERVEEPAFSLVHHRRVARAPSPANLSSRAQQDRSLTTDPAKSKDPYPHHEPCGADTPVRQCSDH